jgi:CRISPR-associated protein (TIGR02584 family)
MNPIDFPRRILLAVTGLTPQIVTETLYALAVATKPGFIPTEIHVITTQEGANRIRLSLLDNASGQFHALCREYDLPPIAFPVENIHLISDAAGLSLDDIRSPEDNLRAADYISRLVRDFCLDEKAALHVSIAGGRKSMGFFVGYALSLFGRNQDALSHVLINAPFESLSDFYFPPKLGKVLHDRNGAPVHTDDARIMLAEIPFVRLRGGVPASLLSGNVSFAETVSGIQSGLNFASLKLDIDRRAICCSEKWITLPPVLFAFYLWLARRCRAGLPDGGGIHWLDANLHTDFLTVYGELVKKNSEQWKKTEEPLLNGFESGEYFEQKVSKINSILRKNLPRDGQNYLIATTGKKPEQKYVLTLLPEQITEVRG